MQSQYTARRNGTWPDGSVVISYDLDYLVVDGVELVVIVEQLEMEQMVDQEL